MMNDIKIRVGQASATDESALAHSQPGETALGKEKIEKREWREKIKKVESEMDGGADIKAQERRREAGWKEETYE